MEQRAESGVYSSYPESRMSSTKLNDMDRIIVKTKSQKLKKYWPYMAGGALLLLMIGWLVFGNHASTLKVNADDLTMSEVTRAEFKDYVRTNGQVLPIQVVQISPEEGGIVMEKVVEEGTHVKKGDVIVRLSNSNLDLQILNAEAELAEKQNLLRNTHPEIFKAQNDYLVYNTLERAKMGYGRATRDAGKASDCIQCGQCEGACPQHLPIRELLTKVAAKFER